MYFYRPLIENAECKPDDEPSAYRNVFNDSSYDGTLVKKYLTEELFKKLIGLPNEPSIIDCIAKVNTLQRNPFGVIVSNGNCYNTFSDLFEPIIKEIHCVDEFIKHSDCDWGDASVFGKLESESIVSLEINCSRSLANIPFISGASEQDLEAILIAVSLTFENTMNNKNT